MNFIDEAKIYLKAGDGGDGAVSFCREKYIDNGGPDGGDGGRGGSIILKSSTNTNTLVNFRYNQYFKAENGENGKGANRSGKSRESIILLVPVGTQIFPENTDFLLYDFIEDNKCFEIFKGGKGGFGNSHFKSSINQAPRRRTEGELGEEMWINLRLKLLSDVGLIGFPNAGKSTFLAAVTAAKPKIADYPFTTLTPNLGVVYLDGEEFVIADIPGLIEGAHLGQGLGDKFLKHIERCSLLIHLVDMTSDNIQSNYLTIRNELISYSEILKEKIEIICLNKSDALSDQQVQDKIKELQQVTKEEIFVISSYSKVGLDTVLRKALKIIQSVK